MLKRTIDGFVLKAPDFPNDVNLPTMDRLQAGSIVRKICKNTMIALWQSMVKGDWLGYDEARKELENLLKELDIIRKLEPKRDREKDPGYLLDTPDGK